MVDVGQHPANYFPMWSASSQLLPYDQTARELLNKLQCTFSLQCTQQS